MTPERQAAEEQAAQEYARAIRRISGDEGWYWATLNTDIVARWSESALRRVKQRAWKIVEAGR